MKINYILYVILIVSVLTGCDNSEDTTPSLSDQNTFEPAGDDNSETAQIRREFYNSTGSYLLFNDTLRTVSSGTSASGSEMFKTEILDIMGYTMIGYGSSTKYVYGYITSPEEQRKAVELINDHLIWRMGKALPYAFFLVDNISYWDSSKKVNVYETKLLGLRAYAISLNGGAAFDDPETYFRGMINDMIRTKLLTMSDEELASFYKFSQEYYDEYKTDHGLSANVTSGTDLWEFGFISAYGTIFPSRSSDLQSWINIVTTNTREQFESKYNSAVMLSKYDALTGIIEELGYVLQ